ncbi:MAG: thioredoxin domain-containing protein, partial [Anaerolineaceae bacterium]|nr:thioredoxin domain-containing protein [Anaerolineaceae bacterium]
MTSDHIIDVSEENFEFEVLNYSSKVPVVVDFWANWCVPCRVLEPMLHRFAQDAEGTFRLARVNVDENPKLAERLKVKKLPAVKAFVDGRIVSEFTGVLAEPNLREFLAHLTPAQSDLLLEKGKSLLLDRLWTDAEVTFREFLSVAPNHPGALLGLANSLIRQGKVREAELILVRFPASAEFNRAERLRTVVKAFNWLSTDQTKSTDPLDAAYRNGVRI